MAKYKYKSADFADDVFHLLLTEYKMFTKNKFIHNQMILNFFSRQIVKIFTVMSAL